MRKVTLMAGAAAVMFAAAASAGGGLATWVDQGWYQHTGTHSPTNTNYIVGKNSSAAYYRNFGVFDLSGFSGVAQSATLRIFQPNNAAAHVGPDTAFNLMSYEGVIADLIGGTAGVGGYADLGDGTLLGSVVIGVSSTNTIVNISFNAAGLAHLTSKFGGQVAIGGNLAYDDNLATHRSFGFSGAAFWELEIDTEIPAPGALTLLGAAGLVSRRRRRG